MREDKDLLKRLGALGYPLLEIREEPDANRTIADTARTRDLRLWEGFPVILANSASRNLFQRDKALRYLEKAADRSALDSMIAMSLALYKAIGRRFLWAEALYKSLGAQARKEYGMVLKALKYEKDFRIDGRSMSGARLKEAFNNYFAERESGLSELLLSKEEIGVEYALSQIFSPKQKDLFLRKLKGEKFTKTEREYFSRVVKKKALALANPELHRLARKVLE